MPGAHAPKPGTEKHRAPRQPPAELTRPALIVAFPAPTAMAVPQGEVGRDWLADHGRLDTEISGRHVELTLDGATLRVRDIGSRNGTWAHGHRLGSGEHAELSDGGVLRIGTTLLVYRAELAGPFAPAAPLGELVGPYGLRELEATLPIWRQGRPRNVLIEGATGTGKDLAARLVATALGRDGHYGAVNVAGVPAGVFESQLFGHVAGAFSDAKTGARGVIQAHDGGSVFFDELGELPLELQPKLLRLLENREILPVGGERPVTVDVLLIAATNRSLDEMVECGRFRRDLLARFATARIALPLLRERCEDIFPLAQALARKSGRVLDAAACEVEAVERLLLDPWPDNVRGLMAALERLAAVDTASSGLSLWAVERVLGRLPNVAPRQLTRAAVQAMLDECGANESEAARRLGISRGRLRRYLGKG